MSSGYVYFYFTHDIAPELAAFEKLLNPINLLLTNPATHQILALSPTGAQVSVTRQWIAAQLANRQDVSIQWWHTDSEDVYCRFNPAGLDDQWCVEFGLDGVDEDRAETLISAIWEYFKERCTRGDVAALVVDRTGDLEETNWSAIIGGHERLQRVPDLLVLPRTVKTTGTAGHEQINECPEHTILTKQFSNWVPGDR